MRYIFIFLLLFSFLDAKNTTLDTMKTEPRVALVIGNSEYDDSPVPNAVENSRKVKQFLEQNNFQVVYIENANKRETIKAVRTFDSNIKEDGIVLLYYCGHAVQYKNKNFLVPIDTSIDKDSQIVSEAIESKAIISKMLSSPNRLNIIIIDSSYENPFGEYFQPKQVGLAKINTMNNMDVIFSAKPNTTVKDYSFTTKLINKLSKKGTSNKNGFTSMAIKHKTVYTKISDKKFYFSIPDTLENKDEKMWKETVALGSVASFNFYKKQHPNGKHIKEADKNLKNIEAEVELKKQEELKFEQDKKVQEQKQAQEALELKKQKELENKKFLEDKKAKEEAALANKLALAKKAKRESTIFQEPELILVKSGKVDVLDEDGKSKYNLHVENDLYVGKYEVTNAQYQHYLNDTKTRSKLSAKFASNMQPVVNISYKEAKEYAKWLSYLSDKKYRLPTKQEWEYMARAGSSSLYFWGNRDVSHRNDAWRKEYPDNAHDYAWIKTNSENKTHNVGEKKANKWGIYDVLGNASEWCSSDGKSVLKGGSWASTPQEIELTKEKSEVYTFKNQKTGFRLVLEK